MGIDIEIHAERRGHDHWAAVNTAPRTFAIGGRILYEWTASVPLFCGRDRELSRMFRQIGASSHDGSHPRGFPLDLSMDVLLAAAEGVAPGWPSDDKSLIRRQVQSANAGQGWLLLPELLRHDWGAVDRERSDGGNLAAERVGERFMRETLPALHAFGDDDAVRIIYWQVV